MNRSSVLDDRDLEPIVASPRRKSWNSYADGYQRTYIGQRYTFTAQVLGVMADSTWQSSTERETHILTKLRF